jgi:hypothetical protein
MSSTPNPMKCSRCGNTHPSLPNPPRLIQEDGMLWCDACYADAYCLEGKGKPKTIIDLRPSAKIIPFKRR